MLAKFSVKKPYTIIIAIVMVIILGVVSFLNMDVDLLPNMNIPYAVVYTTYVGASPEQIETAVVSPIEQSMASISNVKSIQSISSENIGMVILEFNNDTNMESSMIEMREGLDRLADVFPEGVGSSNIMKLNPDMLPVMQLAVSVKNMTHSEASEYIEDKILSEIESVEGVASVSASGIVNNMINVELSTEKINALNQQLINTAAQMSGASSDNTAIPSQNEAENIPTTEMPKIEVTKDMIGQILKAQNMNMPTGSIIDNGNSYLVRVGEKIGSFEDLKKLSVMNIPYLGMITLSDIAEITKLDNSNDLYTKVNGENAIMLSVQRQPDYSTVDVSSGILKRLDETEDQFKDINFTIIMDQGEYINEMVSTILKNLVYGGLLAIFVLLIFLKNIKPTFVVGISIVISVVTAFVLMYFAGISLNIISLSGIAISIGMLVDNSIVVIENIYRLRSNGVPAREAAIEGTRQISGAITASTLTTVVVFLPFVFTEGLTRQLFIDMALTIAFALGASLLVALTLVPMASGKMLKKKIYSRNKTFERITEFYVRSLRSSLKHKFVSCVIVLVLLVGSVYLAFMNGAEFMPTGDTGSVSISIETPDEYSNDDTAQELDRLYEEVKTVKGVNKMGIVKGGSGMPSLMGGGGTSAYVLLSDDRELTTDQIAEEIRNKTKDFKSEISVSSAGADITQLSGGEIVIEVYGRELDNIIKAATDIAEIIATIDGTTEVEDGIGKPASELRIKVNKENATKYNLTVAQVFMAVNSRLANETSITTIEDGDNSFDVYILDDRDESINRETIADIEVKVQAGAPVRVGDIADITEAKGFSTINRKGQERFVSVTASVKDGYNVGQIGDIIEEKVETYELPSGCKVEIGGELDSIAEAFNDLFLVLILAIVLIYLVMVAQFQSFLSPLIIMFTIPLAFTGGFFALAALNMPISIVALVGMVLLVGVVVNNGIVYVDYVNQQREAGVDTNEALLIAARDRLRPIIMTALTTIVGLLISAFDTSAGAVMSRPLSVTVIGGLTYSTLLTLYFIPAVYAIFHRKNKPVEEVEEKQV